MTEVDPNGTNQHEAGAKLDAGKVRVGLVLGSFPRALWKVCEVGTFGAAKYTDDGWLEVDNGEARYADAGLRHYLKSCMGESHDPDSGLEHLAHEAWNALARLELASLKAEENERGGGVTTEEQKRFQGGVVKPPEVLGDEVSGD